MSSSLRILIILGLLASIAAGIVIERYVLSGDASIAGVDIEHAKKHLDPTYVCPMHAEIVANEPGSCPICGMDLVMRAAPEEDESDADGRPVVSISPDVINNLGVKWVPVERGTLVRKIETPGFIQQIIKDKYTRYKAPAKGRMASFHAGKGQWLETGDPIVDIELDGLVAVQEKHLALLAAESSAGTDEADDSREVLQDSDAELPATENDQEEPADEAEAEAEAEAKTPRMTPDYTRALLLRAGMTEAQMAELESSGKTSPVITLYARHPGQVVEPRVAEGDHVEANAYLFSLGGLMRVSVIANAFQRDVSWIKSGQPVDIILPHDSQQVWKGVVSQGAVSINTTSQNIGVKLSFNAPKDKVKSGMYVVGNIYGQVRENTLVLPRDAVIYTQNEQRVIVALGEGRFKPVPVKLGISTDTQVEILDGLEEGDRVVVSAQFLIDSESSLQASFRRLSGE